MVSMLISNFLMFLPEKTQWIYASVFAVIVCGIWIPYEERKEKKKQQQKYRQQNPEPARHTAEDQRKLEQLKALKKAGMLSEEEYQEKKRELRQQ